MSSEIKNLDPQSLWENFYSLTQTPRPSKKEEKIQEFLYNFGVQHGLETIKDEVGNIIIRKPATPGMEDRMGVIFQGHLDMVPQKNEGTDHNFETDPIPAYIEGEWVKAKGTTLGADNGIGVSAAMAVLASKDIAHGPVEALFTCDEETGMTGASNLKAGVLKGDILLNVDSEDEGELYVGCAGGVDATAYFEYSKELVPSDHHAFSVSITGLKGGHSGMDINLGRGNANKIFFRLLKELNYLYGARLASISGGSLRNAIPREAFGVITIDQSHVDDVHDFIAKFEATVRNELSGVEPHINIKVESAEMPEYLIDATTQVMLTHAVRACPHGVLRMSNSVPGLVETSNNLALVKSFADKQIIVVGCLLRSSVDTAKESMASRLESVFALAGAEIEFTGSYPGWKPNMDSPILKTMKDVYYKMYGKTPEVKAIHAGLECGILGGAYPHWDMISFGPTIRHPHSPDESVNIPSVQKFWNFLIETLKNIPVKA